MKKRTRNDSIEALCEFQFVSVLERSDNRLWGAHLRVPAHIAKRLVDNASRRVICALNSSPGRQCALVPHGKRSFVITVNKKIRDALGLSFGAGINVRLTKDESTYGLPMPDEFQELLRQEAEGSTYFHALTLGKQRTLLYIIGNVKNPEKRIMRAMTIIRHLKSNKGKINYKLLSAALRTPR